MDMKQEETRCLAVAAGLSHGAAFFDIDGLTVFTNEKPSKVLNLLQVWEDRGWLEPNPDHAPGIFKFSAKAIQSEWWPGLEDKLQPEDHLRMAEYFRREMDPGPKRDAKLALHLESAGDYENAARMMFRAGRELLKQGKTSPGVRNLERVLELLGKSEPSLSNNRLFLRAFVAATEGNPSFGQSMLLGRALDQVLERVRSLPPEPLSVQSLLYGAMGHLGSGHMNMVEPFCNEAWSRARALGESESLRNATLCSGTVYFLRGRFREAIESYESTLGDTEILPEDPLSLATCILLAQCYALAGRISRSLGLLDAILERARALGYPTVALWGRGMLGSILLETGRLTQAEAEFQRLCQQPGWKDQLVAHSAWSWGMAYLHFRQGDMGGAGHFMQNLFQSEKRIGNFFNPSGYEVAVAFSSMHHEEAEKLGLSRFKDIMSERLEKSRKHPASLSIITMFETVHDYPIQISGERALSRLQELEEPLKEHGFYLALTRLHIYQASLLYDLGKREESARKLKQSRHIIKECGSAFLPRQLSHVMGSEPADRLLLRAVTEISQSLGTVLDPERLIRQAIDTINRITGAERGGMFLYEEGRLVLTASRGLSADIVNQPAFSRSMAFIEEVAQTGRGGIRVWGETTDSQKPRVSLAAPLVLRDTIVGVVYQDNRLIKGALRPEDVALVRAFATQMAASLENSRAFQEIERLNRKLAEEKEYYQEETQLIEGSGEIVVKSQAMTKVLSLAAKVAETDTAVLITGETGVGKDLIAREVHRRSRRDKGRFIRVDCAALPETLILSELFGHEKGAFTGADKARIGRFELADTGTILLDEVGELPAEAQAKFLRVLQDGEFERIGASRTQKVDVRVIAATNRDLTKEVREGRFRSDLYYRLNVFPLEVPPLRKRTEDIPPLSYFFLSASGRKLGKSFPGITQKNMKKLLAYPWPGNVRELKHVVERSAILSPYGDFRVYLPGEERGKEVDTGELLTLREVDRDYIQRVLGKTGWKVSGPGGAAGILGLKRSTLISRMKKLGIEKPWKKTFPRQ